MELIGQRILILVCASLLQCFYFILFLKIDITKTYYSHGNTMQWQLQFFQKSFTTFIITAILTANLYNLAS